jgi:hypothetical protein
MADNTVVELATYTRRWAETADTMGEHKWLTWHDRVRDRSRGHEKEVLRNMYLICQNQHRKQYR